MTAISQLDPKLLRILALWSSTDNDGERQSARLRGEALAKKANLTFQDAVRMARSERGDNPFDGFADWQEAQTPGYKAQCAREKAELLRQKEERRAALIVLHGSLEAVLEPCPSEVLLQAAVAPWRKTLAPPYERWTEHLDGWSNWYAPPPAHVAAAIREA